MKREYKLIINKFWKNRNNKQRSFLLLVILPTLLAVFYYGLIAAKLYVVEARFVIKSSEAQQFDLLSGFTGIPAQGGINTDSFILQDYLMSHEIIDAVNNDINIEIVFNHPYSDWFSRLGQNQSREAKIKYWRKRVSSSFDPTSGVTTLKIQAFSSLDAQRLTKDVIRHSEILVNNLSERARADDLIFAQQELARAEQRVIQAHIAINQFRDSNQDLDSAQTAVSHMNIVNELETLLVSSQAELVSLEGLIQPQTSATVDLKRKIAALKSQIASEKNNSAAATIDETQSRTLDQRFADYELLLIERAFAEKAYASALTSLEAARIEAARKHRYLATFVTPSAPDIAIEPRRIRSILTIFLTCFIAWGIGLLGLGSIRDHIGWV